MGATVTFTIQTPTKEDQTISFEIPPLPEGASAKGVTARLWLASDEHGKVVDESTEGWRVDAQVLTRDVPAVGEFDPAAHGPFDMQDKTIASLTTMATWPDGVGEEWTDDQVAAAKIEIAALKSRQADPQSSLGHYYEGITFAPLTEAQKHTWAARAVHETNAFHQRPFEARDFELLVGLDGADGDFAVHVPVVINGVHSSTLLLSAGSSGKCYGTLK